MHDRPRKVGPVPDDAGTGAAGPRASVLRTGVVWLGMALLFAVTLEVCVRFEDYVRGDAPVTGAYSHSTMFVNDSVGWHPRAGARFEKWQIDSLGFRGPEVDRQRMEGRARIVVLGSSETFGQSESPDHEFPRLLADSLNAGSAGSSAPVSGYEVINAGVPGMSVPRMYWVRYVAPDLVVVYPSPTFYLSEDVSEVTRTVRPAQRGRALDGGSTLRLPQRSRQAIDRFLPPMIQVVLKRMLVTRLVASQPDGWEWDEAPQSRLAAFGEHLESLLLALEDDGVEVVLATHASAVSVPLDDSDLMTLTGWRKFHPRATLDAIVDFESQANASTLTLGEEIGVTVVPLHRLIPTDSRLFSDHQHFSDEGSALVASHLSRAILGLGPFPSGR